jgi:hypothetical protein
MTVQVRVPDPVQIQEFQERRTGGVTTSGVASPPLWGTLLVERASEMGGALPDPDPASAEVRDRAQSATNNTSTCTAPTVRGPSVEGQRKTERKVNVKEFQLQLLQFFQLLQPFHHRQPPILIAAITISPVPVLFSCFFFFIAIFYFAFFFLALMPVSVPIVSNRCRYRHKLSCLLCFFVPLLKAAA